MVADLHVLMVLHQVHALMVLLPVVMGPRLSVLMVRLSIPHHSHRARVASLDAVTTQGHFVLMDQDLEEVEEADSMNVNILGYGLVELKLHRTFDF